MIRLLVEEAVGHGARVERACAMLGITARSLQRWVGHDDDGRHGPRHTPSNALTQTERSEIIAIATSPEFRDQSPKQIVPKLADRGRFVASESTFYRVLRAATLQHRRGRARPAAYRPRQHVADGPWQVASWDITYLRSHARGQFIYLYVVADVWSRKILGWAVHEVEASELAAEMIERIRHDAVDQDLAGWVLHSDNGGPMKGSTMLATLQKLGVVPSFSRPRVAVAEGDARRKLASTRPALGILRRAAVTQDLADALELQRCSAISKHSDPRPRSTPPSRRPRWRASSSATLRSSRSSAT